jgi:hypothetical protein
MAKRPFLLLIAASMTPAAAGAQERSPVPAPILAEALKDTGAAADVPTCKSSNPAEVVVCGRSAQRFRIDPNVLAATRALETARPKPPLDASTDQSCTGPNCGGGTIPLVGMALTALKAAELAARGDDWREAFRTHPDAYQVYEEAKAKKTKRPHVSIEVGAASK